MKLLSLKEEEGFPSFQKGTVVLPERLLEVSTKRLPAVTVMVENRGGPKPSTYKGPYGSMLCHVMAHRAGLTLCSPSHQSCSKQLKVSGTPTGQSCSMQHKVSRIPRPPGLD
ncbi:hypothetical protein A6R68_14255 [Neotoma lepida]|uniref:Uncharacterized protein n=1 Tax=Neotoma lepida TaxID=56216 RepID=A0A1A6HA69_NEOLE|nr:hypothetical protein A6R68_14255 [Neotoma lepida]